MNRSKLLSFGFGAPFVLALFSACSSSSTPAAAPGDGGTDLPETGKPDAGTQCSVARDELLKPIDKVATGTVSVVSDTAGTKILYVDASAGGLGNSAKNPHVYVDLGAGTRADLTDKTAPASTAWDLALKRSEIFTNGGDAGVGQGGAVTIAKAFASVTDAEANAATVAPEVFFDADCKAQTDPTGAANTTFASWYVYDEATNRITGPKPNTYVVVGGTGKKYKVGIKAYDGMPDGGTRTDGAGGYFLLQVTAL